MNTKRQIIRKQGQEIDRLDYENNSLKLKLEQAELKIKHLRTKNDRLRETIEQSRCEEVSNALVEMTAERNELKRSVEEYRDLLSKEHERRDRLEQIIENMKIQLKRMHKYKCEAIEWKRAAAVSKRGFNNLMATYAESEKDNNDLSRGLSNALGKVEVFERVLGELPEAAQPEPKTQGE